MFYDLTVPLRAGMPTYDGEPGPSLTPLMTLEEHGVFVSVLNLGVHSGTHVDAPAHFLAGGHGAELYPLDAMLGPCRVVEVPGSGHVDVAALEAAALPGELKRVIFKTGSSQFWSAPLFRRDFRALEADAARWLVKRGIRLVGIDYLSVDPYDAQPKAAHLALLGAGVVVLEGLDLRGVPAGAYELYCLPLRLVGADAAPARVVLASQSSADAEDARGV